MYTVYKITNKINDKTYIGVHKTLDPYDSYMGSGKAIKAAIAKHGKNNFIKEILLVTDSKEEAYTKEKELTENWTSSQSYNMRIGGVGGFTKENSWKGHIARSSKGGRKAVELGKAWDTENAKSAGSKGGLANKGKPKSEAHIQKIKEAWIKKKLQRTSSSAVSS